MSDQDNSAYYLRRQREEMDLAEAATEQHVRKIHLKLADQYRDLAAEPADRQASNVMSYLQPE